MNLNGNNTKGLRFAPLIRVSSESQKTKGNSLTLQKKQIEHIVGVLGGTIPEHCWQYVGTESATTEHERILLDKLLEDSGKGKFDAVIVVDASRWSRNNLKSEQAMEILRKNGVRLFDGPQEVNFDSPDEMLVFRMKISIHQFSATQNALKSFLNKLDCAERGEPQFLPPFGRRYDKEKGLWILDKKKAAMMKEACEGYLRGETWPVISAKAGVSVGTLSKIFNRFLGGDFTVEFKSKHFPKLNKTITFKIPRLVDPETERRVQEKLALSPRKDLAGKKHLYLLKGLARCGECHRMLHGMRVDKRKRTPKQEGQYLYYRHLTANAEGVEFECKAFSYVPGVVLEEAVLRDLFHLFGDQKALQKLLTDANGKAKDRERFERELGKVEKALTKNRKAQANLIKAVMTGALEEQDVKAQMGELKQTAEKLENEVARLQEEIRIIPAPEELNHFSKLVARSYYKSEEHLATMSQKERRELLESIFINRRRFKDSENGVYVYKAGRDRWRYEIRGTLVPEIIGNFTKEEIHGDSGIYVLENSDVSSNTLPKNLNFKLQGEF